MYVKLSEATVPVEQLSEVRESESRVHEVMHSMSGFRWAMLLNCLETPGKLAAVSMWLSEEQEAAQDGHALGKPEETHGYDVTTARGPMTPASHVALVDWSVPDGAAERFTNRWNAAYHAIEDRIGSRLLRSLNAPGSYVGLHAVTDEANLDTATLGGEIKDAEALSLTPTAVHRYEVLLLTEA